MAELVRLVVCPDPTCQAPAEVVDEWLVDETDGIRQRVTRCLHRHRFDQLVEHHPPKE